MAKVERKHMVRRNEVPAGPEAEKAEETETETERGTGRRRS